MSNSTPDDSHRLPQLVAFDLDYTLWDLWIDTHVTGPLRRHKDTVNEVLDKYGDKISFYKDVPDILHGLRSQKAVSENNEDQTVIIAACSRTHAPDLAKQCLRLLLVPNVADKTSPPTPAIDFFDEMEIYPGSKIKHFKALHERTGIPYSEMLFFDDEHRNSEVEKLGVTFYHVPRGLTRQMFEQGLKEWRQRRRNDCD
ncbi:magnesium-dependent phosphatase-1 [Crassisporium funariophilum]|nr:magnesium-dependent phosphatase-1 [Crassisporium funariophilum]